MRSFSSLAWKEWRESRIYLWIALSLFIGMPLLGGLEGLYQYARHFQIETVPWIIACGGLLAVFVAVGATCRDFSGHLEDFWRSRPVAPWQWMLIKYVVGLIVVIIACVIPPMVELAINVEKDATPMIVWFPFLWMAMFSVAFLAGVLIRRTAQAAMLALAAMLLMWFLPIVLPPLQWMDATSLVDGPMGRWHVVFGWRQVHFALGMLGISLVALTIALTAAQREWHIESGRKMMYGSISAAILIVFASAAFQLGTNLPVLAQVDLPKGEEVAIDEFDTSTYVSAVQGTLVTVRYHQNTMPDFYSRSVQIHGNTIELRGPTQAVAMGLYNTAHSVKKDVHYFVNSPSSDNSDFYDLELHVARGADIQTERAIPLWRQARNWPTLKVYQDRLFVIGSHLITFDISDARNPKILGDVPFEFPSTTSVRGDSTGVDPLTYNLPQVPDLPARERLNVLLFRTPWRAIEDDTLCIEGGGVLYAYHLTHLSDSIATFAKIGQYEPTLLEREFGQYSYNGLRLQNGLLYTVTGYWRGGWVNPSLSVFDTRGPHPLKTVGHFAAPGAGAAFPLPDGRALVGGTKLYLIGPPRREQEK